MAVFIVGNDLLKLIHNLLLQAGEDSRHFEVIWNAGEGKGMNLAQKMLEKYGWKEGEGLGKERQGIATPLIAQKTDKRSAVIVKAQQIVKPEPRPPQPQVQTTHLTRWTSKRMQIPLITGNPTRVVLLRNLVEPGNIDDDLEDEVAQELQKYGQVQRVLIFEVTEDNYPPEESVRIFVEFQTVEESQKVVQTCVKDVSMFFRRHRH